MSDNKVPQQRYHDQLKQHLQQERLIVLVVVDLCALYQQVLLRQQVAHTRRSTLALSHRDRLAKTS
jgi:hypothetical protein